MPVWSNRSASCVHKQKGAAGLFGGDLPLAGQRVLPAALWAWPHAFIICVQSCGGSGC